MTIELSPEIEKLVEENARRGGFESPDAFVARILSHALALDGKAEGVALEASRSLADDIAAIWKDLPSEALDQLPSDGADQVDHYVYRLPKRPR